MQTDGDTQYEVSTWVEYNTEGLGQHCSDYTQVEGDSTAVEDYTNTEGDKLS